MIILNWKVANEFMEENANAKEDLIAFKQAISNTHNIKTPLELKKRFGKKIDLIKGNRFCIDIGGTKIRSIVIVEFNADLIDLKWIGWHKDYDKLCKKNKQYSV